MAERVYESKYTGNEVDAAVGIAQNVEKIYVKKSTSINGKALDNNIILTASDIEGVLTADDNNILSGTNTFNNDVVIGKLLQFEQNTTIKVQSNNVDLPSSAGKLALTSDIDVAIQNAITKALDTPV